MHRIGLAILAALSLSTGLPAADDALGGSSGGAEAATPARDDMGFVEQALSGGMFEVRSSQMLLERPLKDPREEDFARMMMEDHSRANRQLHLILQQKGIITTAQMRPEHQALLDDLAELDGDELQKRYHEYQISVHAESLGLFAAAANEVQDPQLKAYALEMLPTLRAHADHLRTHDASLGR